MNPNARTVASAATRPSRILIILAAAWMAIAIAMGGVIAAEPTSDTADPATTSIGIDALDS